MKKLAATLALAFAAASAHAGVLFTNGTDPNNSIGGNCSACSGSWRVYDSFTLASASTLTGFSLSASVGQVTGDLQVSIWTAPGSGMLYSQSMSEAALGLTTYSHFNLNEDLPNWTLEAGTYWISFYAYDLYMPQSVHKDNSAIQIDPVYGRYARGYDVPFTLEGHAGIAAVPEPGALALIGLGLAGMGAAVRRRKSA